MAWLQCNPMICRRYLLLTVFSIAFAYPVCLVLMSSSPTRHETDAAAAQADPVAKWGLAGHSTRHLASRFDLQYLMDAGGKQAEIDDTPVGDNRGIPMQDAAAEYGGRPGRLFELEQRREQPGRLGRHHAAGEKSTRRAAAVAVEPLDGSPFQAAEAEVPGVPRTIHQTWENLVIPGQNAECVESWKKQHPSWQYWFWTESGASLMIHRNFSQYADMYTDYPYAINRADARRYFIMYKYGGVYADLDVESLRPLDDLLRDYKCIIAQEPPEHQVLVYRNRHANYVMPAFIACRPRHPFFRMVLEMLPQHASKAKNLAWNENIFQSTGPMFLAQVLERYLQERNGTADEYIHVAPSHWFMPTFDSMNEMSFRSQCSNETELTVPRVKVICDRLRARDFSNVPSIDSFTTHHWVHSWSSTFLARGHVALTDILRQFSFRIIDGK